MIQQVAMEVAAMVMVVSDSDSVKGEYLHLNGDMDSQRGAMLIVGSIVD